MNLNLDVNGETPDPQALLAAASVETGCDDYGDEWFVERFTRYVGAAAAEGNLSPMGWMGFSVHLNRLLVNRLRFHDDLKRHPEIRDEVVSDPIVITGLPRTGTTKLQRMMSLDPAMQALSFWRVFNPAPLPESGRNGEDPRIAIARGYEEIIKQLAPGLMAAHPFGAEEAEEDVFLHEMTFQSFGNALRLHVPRYLAWVKEQPQHDVYKYLRGLLQYLQWQDGADGSRPWVLKNPFHLGQLVTLFETFPDATVVHCHRDPVVTIPSFARLLEAAWSMMSDDVDPLEIGNQAVRLWAGQLEENRVQRDRLQGVARMVDVHYDDIRQDALAVIQEVYQQRGLTLSAEAKDRMRVWEKENPQHRFGRHSYSAERYGLTSEGLREIFAPYYELSGASPGTAAPDFDSP